MMTMLKEMNQNMIIWEAVDGRGLFTPMVRPDVSQRLALAHSVSGAGRPKTTTETLVSIQKRFRRNHAKMIARAIANSKALIGRPQI